ncbi:MAG: type II toxin-antitoxin system RelE/ParE family toxin [Gemmataceae bacterium]|jgi:proteic killer suppression protein
MIVSFADRATEVLFHTGRRSGRMPPDIVPVALRKLDMLNVAANLHDLRSPPGNRLEALRGRLAGLHSIRINGQWRLVFRWLDADAHDVQIVDYHS